MREQLISLGCRIRELRKKHGMTLQTLAEKTNLTAGLLSKIENFRTIPSLPVLLDIARALETDLSDLFEGFVFSEKKNWVLVKKSEQREIEREANHGLQYRMIFETPLNGVNLQVMFVSDGKGHGRVPVSTEADELIYILSGKLPYRVGADRISLEEGDLLFFDGSLPHGPEHKAKEHFSLLAFYFLRSEEERSRQKSH